MEGHAGRERREIEGAREGEREGGGKERGKIVQTHTLTGGNSNLCTLVIFFSKFVGGDPRTVPPLPSA